MATKQTPPKKWPVKRMDIVVGLIFVVLFSFGIWRSFYQNKPVCDTPGQTHELSVFNDSFNTEQLAIKQCDVIKVINYDTQNYMFAFGVHDKHIAYPGFNDQQVVGPNEFITIDAFETGDFRIHDHLRDKAAIELTITAK